MRASQGLRKKKNLIEPVIAPETWKKKGPLERLEHSAAEGLTGENQSAWAGTTQARFAHFHPRELRHRR